MLSEIMSKFVSHKPGILIIESLICFLIPVNESLTGNILTSIGDVTLRISLLILL